MLHILLAFGFWQAFHPLMIGFAINFILPGRIGEVARPVILQKKSRVPFETGLATVGIERIFDIVLLLGLFVILLYTVQIDPEITITFSGYNLNCDTLLMIGTGFFKLIMLLLFSIVFISLEPCRLFVYRLISVIPEKLFFVPEKLAQGLIRGIDGFVSGLALIRHPKQILLCFGLSVLLWMISGISYYILALGSPGMAHVSFMQMTAVMVIISFFIALPSVPGFWGLWEAGGLFGLSLFGVSGGDSAGFALSSHVVQMFPVIITGLVSALVINVKIREVVS